MDRPNPGLHRDSDPQPILHDEQSADYDEATAGTHRHQVAGTETDETAGGTYRTGTTGAFRNDGERVGPAGETAGNAEFSDAPGDPEVAGEARPAGGYAQMPAAAPSPAAGGTPPMPGDTHVMSTPEALRRFDPWNYRTETSLGDGADVVGYAVHAIDGHIGKIDESSTLVGDSYLVVDTGPWIFGKRVLLPAGTVNHVDSLDAKIYVDRTKSQIKDSPEFDPDTFGPEYRDKLGGYYDSTYQDPSYQGPNYQGSSYQDPSYQDPSYRDPAGEQPARDHSAWGDSRSVE